MLNVIIGILWILLIVGLISPAFFSKMFRKEYSRKKIALILIPAMIVVAGISSALSPKEAATDQPIQSTATPTPTPVTVLFDLSTAKGKTPEQIYTLLGQPTRKDAGPNAAQKALIAKGQTWEMNDEWEKDGQTLLLTHDYTTGVVTDFFLDCSENGTGSCPNNETTITKLKAQLNADVSGMRVEAVPTIKDETQITGIKLIP